MTNYIPLYNEPPPFTIKRYECIILFLVVIILYLLLLLFISPVPASKSYHWSSSLPIPAGVGSFDLICRTYYDSIFELWRFIFTYQLFWPLSSTNNKLIIILDDESEYDQQLATILEAAWSIPYRLEIYTEKLPKEGTLSAQPIGYYRSQYSNFYSDLYSDTEWIGIIDSDIQFFRTPNHDDFFIENRAILRFVPAHRVAHDHYKSTEWLIGKPFVGDYMIHFPVIIKREHFALMRQHIISQHPEFNDFEGVWGEMNRIFGGRFGNFLIMGNYLFYYHYDEYIWRMEEYFTPAQTSGMVDSSRYKYPSTYLTKHIPFDMNDKKLFIERIYQNLCVSSNFLASSCERSINDKELKELGYRWLFTDDWVSKSEPKPHSRNIASYIDWRKKAQSTFDQNGGQDQWLRTQWKAEDRIKVLYTGKGDKNYNYSYPPELPFNP